MRLLSRITKSMLGKAALAAVVLGGLLTFAPAKASAEPVFVARSAARVVVRRGFYGPRVYAGPRVVVSPGFYYGPVYPYGPVYVPHRYWDARFHCWRYR